MPKQRIQEIDLTSAIRSSSTVNTVYIPIHAVVTQDAKLCTTVDELDTYIEAGGTVVTGDNGKLVSEYLVNKGMYVLAQTVASDTHLKAAFESLKDRGKYDIRFITTGAGDLTNWYDEAIDCAATRKDCVYLCDYKVSDTEVTYILQGAEPSDWSTKWTNYFTKSEEKKTLEETRGTTQPNWESNKYYKKVNEVFYLTIEEPTDWDSTWQNYYEIVITYSSVTGEAAPTWEADRYYTQISTGWKAATVRSYYKTNYANYIVGSTEKAEHFKYVAAFVPSFKTSSLSTTEITLPASFGYLFSYVNSIINDNAEWLACAGSFRGSIPELSDVVYDYSNAECEILQSRAASGEVELDASGDNADIAINPIANIRPFGYIIWGNRTLLKPDLDGTLGVLKASNFLNIRQLVSTINKELYNAARKYTFEQNTNTLWIRFQTELAPTLEKMKSGSGILDYRWKKGTTTKKARLVASLRIIPIEALEDFDLTIELTDSLEVVE